MSFLPKRPTGSDPFHVWAQWVHDQLTQRLRFNNSSTVRFHATTQGISATAAAQQGVGASPVSATIKIFTYITSYGDYVLCEDVSTGLNVRVAKPDKLRNSLLTANIYGAAVAYAYPHNVAADVLYGLYRVSTIGGFSQNEGVVPQYLIGDDVVGVQMSLPTIKIEMQDQIDTAASVDRNPKVMAGQPLGWLDLNAEGRAWAKFANPNF